MSQDTSHSGREKFQETPESYLKRILDDCQNGVKYLEVALINSKMLEIEHARLAEDRMREHIRLGEESLQKALIALEEFNRRYKR